MICQDRLARVPAAIVPGWLCRLRPGTVGCLAVLLWVAGVLQLTLPGRLPAFVSPLLVVAVTVLVVPDLTRSLRAPLTLCIAALAALMLHAGQTESVLAALDFAAPFAAFLVSIAILRGNLLSARRLAKTRARLAAQDATGRRSVLLLLSCLLGGVFSIGGFPMLAPLVDATPGRETDRLASAILCGNALALLWSPFTVGMGFAAAAVGVADGFAYLPHLLAAAAVGLVVALAVHGWPRPATLRAAGAAATPLLPPFAAAIAATLAISALLHMRVTDAVVLMAPAVAVVAMVGRTADRPEQPPVARLRPAAGRALAGLALAGAGGAVRDLPMYIAGFALARALAESGLFGGLIASIAGSSIGAGLVLPPLGLAMALAGLPALVSGGVIAAAANTMMPLSDPGARLVLTLFAWLATTLLSVTGMSVLATASNFGTKVRRLVLGRNLLVAVLLAAALAVSIR
jgi:hypothetical protein